MLNFLLLLMIAQSGFTIEFTYDIQLPANFMSDPVVGNAHPVKLFDYSFLRGSETQFQRVSIMGEWKVTSWGMGFRGEAGVANMVYFDDEESWTLPVLDAGIFWYHSWKRINLKVSIAAGIPELLLPSVTLGLKMGGIEKISLKIGLISSLTLHLGLFDFAVMGGGVDPGLGIAGGLRL